MIGKISFAVFSTIFLLGIANDIINVAEETGNKTIQYSSEIDSAVDCAFSGIEIEKCSPQLISDGDSFKQTKKEFEGILNRAMKTSIELYTDEHISFKDKNDEYILKLQDASDSIAKFDAVRISDLHNMKEFSVLEGERKQIDINKDGISDVILNPEKIEPGRVTLDIRLKNSNIIITLGIGMIFIVLMLSILLYVLISVSTGLSVKHDLKRKGKIYQMSGRYWFEIVSTGRKYHIMYISNTDKNLDALIKIYLNNSCERAISAYQVYKNTHVPFFLCIKILQQIRKDLSE